MITNKAIKILKKVDNMKNILTMIKDYSFSWHCDCEICKEIKKDITEALE